MVIVLVRHLVVGHEENIHLSLHYYCNPPLETANLEEDDKYFQWCPEKKQYVVHHPKKQCCGGYVRNQIVFAMVRQMHSLQKSLWSQKIRRMKHKIVVTQVQY